MAGDPCWFKPKHLHEGAFYGESRTTPTSYLEVRENLEALAKTEAMSGFSHLSSAQGHQHYLTARPS